MELIDFNIKNGLCISLGANIDSNIGTPIETLLNCREETENILNDWINAINNGIDEFNINHIFYTWSSLYETSPHGVQDKQPNYINTVLLVKSEYFQNPSIQKAIILLKEFKDLENKIGREPISKSKMLARCIDIDILWWEDLCFKSEELTLPHPRLFNRNFVITPLSELLGRDQTIKKIYDQRWII